MDIIFKKFTNPADVCMQVLSINYPKSDDDELKIQKFVQFYNSELKQQDADLADKFKLSEVNLKERRKPGCCFQFRQLCRRNVSSIKRNPFMFKARVGQTLFMALISTAVFYQSNGPTRKDMQDMIGAMFFMSMALFMPPYMMTGLTFQTERPVFLREQANKMYCVTAYFCAKILSELPSFVVPPAFYILITYFSIGFTESYEEFFKFLLNAVMTAMGGISFGYLISSTFKD